MFRPKHSMQHYFSNVRRSREFDAFSEVEWQCMIFALLAYQFGSNDKTHFVNLRSVLSRCMGIFFPDTFIPRRQAINAANSAKWVLPIADLFESCWTAELDKLMWAALSDFQHM